MKCTECGYIYNGVEEVSNCPKCGHSYGSVDEKGLSNKSKAAVAIGAAAGAVAGLGNLAMQNETVSAKNGENLIADSQDGQVEEFVELNDETTNFEGNSSNGDSSSSISDNTNSGNDYESSANDSIDFDDNRDGSNNANDSIDIDTNTAKTDKDLGEGDTYSNKDSEETGEDGDTETEGGSEETGEGGDTETEGGSEETGEGEDTETDKDTEDTGEDETEEESVPTQEPVTAERYAASFYVSYVALETALGMFGSGNSSVCAADGKGFDTIYSPKPGEAQDITTAINNLYTKFNGLGRPKNKSQQSTTGMSSLMNGLFVGDADSGSNGFILDLRDKLATLREDLINNFSKKTFGEDKQDDLTKEQKEEAYLAAVGMEYASVIIGEDGKVDQSLVNKYADLGFDVSTMNETLLGQIGDYFQDEQKMVEAGQLDISETYFFQVTKSGAESSTDLINEYKNYGDTLSLIMTMLSMEKDSAGNILLNTANGNINGQSIDEYVHLNVMDGIRTGLTYGGTKSPNQIQLEQIFWYNGLSDKDRTPQEEQTLINMANVYDSYCLNQGYENISTDDYVYGMLKDAVMWESYVTKQGVTDAAGKEIPVGTFIGAEPREGENGVQIPGRGDFGNVVVDIYGRIVDSHTPAERIERDPFEESFRLNRDLYDYCMPNLTTANNIVIDVTNGGEGYKEGVYNEYRDRIVPYNEINDPELKLALANVIVVDGKNQLFQTDANGNVQYDSNGNPILLTGMDMDDYAVAYLIAESQVAANRYTQLMTEFNVFSLLQDDFASSVQYNSSTTGPVTAVELYDRLANPDNPHHITADDLMRAGSVTVYDTEYKWPGGNYAGAISFFLDYDTAAVNSFNDSMLQNKEYNISVNKMFEGMFNQATQVEVQEAKTSKTEEVLQSIFWFLCEMSSNYYAGQAYSAGAMSAGDSYAASADLASQEREQHWENSRVYAERANNLNNMVVVSNERLNFLNNQWLTILPQFSDFEITAVPIKVEGLSYEDGTISDADRELIEKAVTDNLEQSTDPQVQATIKQHQENGTYEEYINDLVANQEAMIILQAQASGITIDTSLCSPHVRSLVENFGFLSEEERNLALGCLQYSFSRDGLTDFAGKMNDMSQYGFNLEAQRLADEIAASQSQEFYNNAIDFINTVGLDGTAAQGVVELIYGLSSACEWTYESVLLPASWGIDGFFEGLDNATLSLLELIPGVDLNDASGILGLIAGDYGCQSMRDAVFSNLLAGCKNADGSTNVTGLVMQASQSMGNMAIPMIISSIPLPGFKALGTALLGVSAYGNTFEQSIMEGMDEGTAFFYSVLSAGAEVVMEKVLGAMPGIGSVTANTMVDFVGDMFDEAREEIIQDLLDPLLLELGTTLSYLCGSTDDKGIINLFDEDGGRYFASLYADKDMQQLLETGVVAMISSGMSHGIAHTTQNLKYTQVGSIMYTMMLEPALLLKSGVPMSEVNKIVASDIAALMNNNGPSVKTIADSIMANPGFNENYTAWSEQQKADNTAFKEFTPDYYALMLAVNQVTTNATTLDAQINATNAQIDTLVNSLTELEAKYEQMKSEGVASTTELNAIAEQITDAKSKIETLSDQVTDLTNQYNALESEVSAEIEQTNSQIETLQNENANLNEQLQNTDPSDTNTIDDINQQIKNNNNQILNLNNTNILNQNRITLNTDSMVSKLDSLNARLESLNNQEIVFDPTAHEQKKATITNEIERTKTSLGNRLINTKNLLLQDINTLNQTIERMGTETPNLKKYRDSLIEKVNGIDSKLESLGINPETSGSTVTETVSTPETATVGSTGNITTDITAKTNLVQNITTIGLTVAPGASTIGDVISGIKNYISGLENQVQNGKYDENGNSLDPENPKSKQEVEQEIQEKKKIEQDLLTSMTEYSMNENSPLKQFIDEMKSEIRDYELSKFDSSNVAAAYEANLATVTDVTAAQLKAQISELIKGINSISYSDIVFNDKLNEIFDSVQLSFDTLSAKVNFNESLNAVESILGTLDISTELNSTLTEQLNGLRESINSLNENINNYKLSPDSKLLTDIKVAFNEISQSIDSLNNNLADTISSLDTTGKLVINIETTGIDSMTYENVSGISELFSGIYEQINSSYSYFENLTNLTNISELGNIHNQHMNLFRINNEFSSIVNDFKSGAIDFDVFKDKINKFEGGFNNFINTFYSMDANVFETVEPNTLVDTTVDISKIFSSTTIANINEMFSNLSEQVSSMFTESDSKKFEFITSLNNLKTDFQNLLQNTNAASVNNGTILELKSQLDSIVDGLVEHINGANESGLVLQNVNGKIVVSQNTEINISESTDVLETLTTIEDVPIDNPLDKLGTTDQVLSIKNEFGQIDLSQAESTGLIDIDRIPSRDISGFTAKNWIKTQDGYVLFKQTTDGTYEAIGEILASNLANAVGVDAAQYDIANLDGRNGVVSIDFTNGSEFISGIELLTTLNSELSAVEGLFKDIVNTYNSSTDIDTKKLAISELIEFSTMMNGLSSEFTSLIDAIDINSITSENVDSIFEQLNQSFEQLINNYTNSINNIRNENYNIVDIITMLDIHASVSGIDYSNRTEVIESLVKMHVFDSITSPTTRTINDMGILFDDASNTIKIAPIFDNSGIFGFDTEISSLEQLIDNFGSSTLTEDSISKLKELYDNSDTTIREAFESVINSFDNLNLDSIFETMQQNNVEVSQEMRDYIANTIEANLNEIKSALNINESTNVLSNIEIEGVSQEIADRLNEINNSVSELITEINSQNGNIENIETIKLTFTETIKSNIAEILSNSTFINEIHQTFEGITKSLEGLKNLPANIKNSLINLANSIQNKLTSIIDKLKAMKPQLDPKEIAAVKEELIAFKQTLSDTFKTFFDTKTNDMKSMEDAVLDAEFEQIETVSVFAKITESLTDFFSNLQESINSQIMLAKLDGIDLSLTNLFNISDSLAKLDNFIKSVDTKTSEFETKVKNYIGSLIESVKNTFSTKSNVVQDFDNITVAKTSFAENISNYIKSALDLTKNLFNKSNITTAEKTNLSTKLENLGKQITDYITGLYQGTTTFSKEVIDKFVSEFSKLGDSINKTAETVKTTVKDALASHVDKVLNANYSNVNEALTELFKHDTSVESTVKVIESFMSSGNFGMFDLLNLTGSNVFNGNKSLLNAALETVIANNSILRAELYSEIRNELSNLSSSSMGIGLNISESDIDALTEALLGPNFVQDGYGSQDWNKFKQILEPYVKQNIKNSVANGVAPVLWTKVDPSTLTTDYITIENSTFNEDSLYMLQMIFPNWYNGQSSLGNLGLETLWANMSEIYASAIIDASVTDYIKFVYNDAASGFGNLFLSVELPALLKSGKFNTLGAFSQATQTEVAIDLKLMSQVYNYMANNGMQSLLTPQKLASWMSDLLNGVTPADYTQVINANQTIVTNVGNVTATTVQTKNVNFLSYSNNFALFDQTFSAATNAWVANLSAIERSFVTNYTGEDRMTPGNYKSVNAILRGQFTKTSTELTFYGAYGGGNSTYTVSDFVLSNKNVILSYYNQVIGTNPYTDFTGSEVDILYQAYLAYQTRAAEVLIQGISKFAQPIRDEGIMLFRKQGIRSLSKQFGFTANQSVDEIFKALTTYPDGSKRDQFVFDSFTSTSINDSSDGYPSPDSVFFKIKCDETIQFADVMKLSLFGKGEGELLLNAGQYFRIESVEKSSSGNIVINLAPYHTSGSMVDVTTQTVTATTTMTDPLVSALNYLNSGDVTGINSLNLTEAQQTKFFKEALDNGYYANVVKMASHFTIAAEVLVEKGDFSFLQNNDVQNTVIYKTILHIGNTYGIESVNNVLNTYMSSMKQKEFFIELLKQNKGYIVSDLAVSNAMAARTMLEVGNYSFLTNPQTSLYIKLDAIDYLDSLGKLSSLNGIYTTDSQFAYSLFKNGVEFSYPNDPSFKTEFYNYVVNNIILKQGNKFMTAKALKLFNSMGYQNSLISINNMDHLLGAITNNFTEYQLDPNFVQDGIEIIRQIISQESLQNAISIVNSFAVNNTQYLSDLFNSNIPVDLKIKLLGSLPGNIANGIKFDLVTSTSIYTYLSGTNFDTTSCCNLLGLDSSDTNNHFIAVKQIAELAKSSARELISVFKNNVPGSYQYNEAINMLKQYNPYYANMTDEQILKDVTSHFGNAQQKLYDIGVDRIHTIGYNGININIYCGNPANLSTALNRAKHITKLIDSLPYVLRTSIKELNIFDTNNPFDEYWACEYDHDINSGFYSAATGGFGQVNIWNITPQMDTIAHELGHCLDSKIFEQLYGYKGYITDAKGDWAQAIAADGNSVSSYGDKALVEDLAESVSLYITNPAKFFKKHSKRAKVLMDMFNQYLENELGFSSKMTRSQVNKRLLEFGFDSNFIRSYLHQGYTIYDIKNAWFRTLMTNESFDSAITIVRSTNNTGGFLSKLFGKNSNIVHISDNSQGLIIDDSLLNITYSQCVNSLDSAFTTMVNKFGYQETIKRFKEYLATGNIKLITRTNDARKIIESIPVEHVQTYLDNIGNPNNTQKFTPKQVETVDFDLDGVVDVMKVNEITDDIIASINKSSEAVIIFDEDIDITEELLSKLNDDVQISYGKSNYVYGKDELIKIIGTVNDVVSKVNSQFTKTETIKFVYDYIVKNYTFTEIGNPDLNALVTGNGTNAAFTEIFYEIMDKLALKGVSVEILKGLDVDGNEVIFNAVRADGLTFLIDSTGFGNINPANIKLTSESVLFDSITENDIFIAEKIAELIDVTNESGMNLHEAGAQTSNNAELITPELQAKADELAKSLFEKASLIESSITEDMKSFAVNGSKLIGLEHSLKSIESLSRKILSVHLMSLKTANVKTLESIATNEIADSVRYTLVCDEANYVEQVKQTIQGLIAKGYQLKVFRNTWHSNTYKGVNTNFIAPDGTVFELQFHTDTSYAVKGEMTHTFYEIIRNSFTTKVQKDIAGEIREAYQKLITIPEGIIGLTMDDVLPPSSPDSSSDSGIDVSTDIDTTEVVDAEPSLTLADLVAGNYPQDPIIEIAEKKVMIKGKVTSDGYDAALKHFVQIPNTEYKYSVDIFKSELSSILRELGYSDDIIADVIKCANQLIGNSEFVNEIPKIQNFTSLLSQYLENNSNPKLLKNKFTNISADELQRLINDLLNIDTESLINKSKKLSNGSIIAWQKLLKASGYRLDLVDRMSIYDISNKKGAVVSIEEFSKHIGLELEEFKHVLLEAKDQLMKNAIQRYFDKQNLLDIPEIDGVGLPIPVEASVDPSISEVVEVLVKLPKDGENADLILFHLNTVESKVYSNVQNALNTLYEKQAKGIINQIKNAKAKGFNIEVTPEAILKYLSDINAEYSYYIRDDIHRREVYNRIIEKLFGESKE